MPRKVVKIPFRWLILVVWLSTGVGLAQPPVDFEQDVAPLFRKHCIRCHSGAEPKGDLSLQSRGALLADGWVEPGDSRSSSLFEMLTAEAGERPAMPAKGRPLEESEITLIRRWIDAGAIWPQTITLSTAKADANWWSLQPVADPQVPRVDDPQSWCRSPIDRFVLRRLRNAHLTPAKIATRRLLIRRLKFDLLGLPPTPQEIELFLNDERADAWPQLVDRYLASPHYGEHWGRHWLDVVRFSESDGFEDDAPRADAWPYRDWVIRSLNADKPYNQFVREQIAGDVIEPVTHDGIIATSMLVNGPFDFAAAVSLSKTEKLRSREAMLEEMLATVGQTFMGLTVNCARCHDHKFDPVPLTDYYGMKAVFAGVEQADGAVHLPQLVLTADERASRDALMTRIEQKQAVLANLKRQRMDCDDSTNLPPLNSAIALWQFDGSAVKDGQNHEPDRKGGESRIEAKWSARFGQLPASQILAANSDGLVLDAGPGVLKKNQPGGAGYAIIPSLRGSELLPRGGAMTIFARVRYTGRFDGVEDVFRIGDTGNKHRDSIGFEFISTDKDGQTAQARFVVTGTGQQQEVAVTLDASLALDTWYDLVGVFEPGRMTLTVSNPNTGQPVAPPVSQEVAFDSLESGGSQNLLFFVAPSFENGPQPNAQLDVAAVWQRALVTKEVRQLSTLEATIALTDTSHEKRVRDLDARIAEAERELQPLQESLDSAVKALTGLRRQSQPTVILERGDINLPGDIVQPGGLSVVAGLPADLGLQENSTDAERRRAYAQWIVDPRHPLTARVMVNRVWHHHFGRGLVATPSDFGFNGGRPSHPHLLDWLTSRFVEEGWSLKALHRRILLSATWQQAATWNPTAAKNDADNQLLWRYAPRRLEAETVRDAMLTVSGELDPALGGPSFQPFTITRFNTYFYHLIDDDRPEFRRRTIYRMHVNTGRDPMLDALDCPAPSVMTPVRRSTTTPLQALALMNDVFVLRQADKLAERIRQSGVEMEDVVDAAWQRCLGRSPTPDEQARAQTVVDDSGLSTLCWVLFNSSEFLYVR
jgi:Protein of unknown function (DUF1553)/Protein of unknown function (DUF1549)/Planctomycete cytochrome C